MEQRSIPLVYKGRGEFIAASTYWQTLAEERYEKHKMYVAEMKEERTEAQHRYYFEMLAQAWGNLPENKAPHHPTVEALRKHALIATGHYSERVFVATSSNEAWKVSAFIDHENEKWTVVSVSGNIVIVRTALSQKYNAMGKVKFQKSMDDVLDYAWGLCGLTKEEAASHVGTIA